MLTVEDLLFLIPKDVSKSKLDAFCNHMKGLSMVEISKLANVSSNTLGKWSREGWWKKAKDMYLEKQREVFAVRMVDMQSKAIDALEDVLDNPDPKTASARIAAVKLLTEVGDNPLLKKIPQVQINQQNLITGVLNMEAFNRLPLDRQIEIARTGDVPDEVKMIEE